MKSVFLILSMLASSIFGFSQSESTPENSKFRFGFNIGANYSNLQVQASDPEKYEITNGIGGSLGILMEYSITKNFAISPKAELVFNNAELDLIYPNVINYTYEISPISANLMAHFQYKFGEGNVFPYIFSGPNFKIPISRKPEISTDFYTRPDFAIDFGVGIENKNKYFIFSPELRYSWGLINANQNPTIRVLYFHSITLVLNFK